jgi:hypothetical protein
MVFLRYSDNSLCDECAFWKRKKCLATMRVKEEFIRECSEFKSKKDFIMKRIK